MFSDFLGAGFNVALDHQAFYHLTDLIGMTAAVENFLYNADLLHVLLVGIGMVGVHDAGPVLYIPLLIEAVQQDQVLVVVVGQALAMLAHRSPQDGVGQGIAVGLHFPLSHDKLMTGLGGHHSVEHDG